MILRPAALHTPRRFCRLDKRIISDSGTTSERIRFGLWIPTTTVTPNPLWIGVTAAWPCQETCHADRSANRQISHRCGTGSPVVIGRCPTARGSFALSVHDGEEVTESSPLQ
jgi:hypothetical protein